MAVGPACFDVLLDLWMHSLVILDLGSASYEQGHAVYGEFKLDAVVQVVWCICDQ